MAPVPMGASIRVVLDNGYVSVEAWGNATRMRMQQFWPESDPPDGLREAVRKANQWAQDIGITLGVNTHLLDAA